MRQPQTLFDTHLPPLADRLRPKSLEDYKGQSHLLGDGKLLRKILEEKKTFSMIFCETGWFYPTQPTLSIPIAM